MIKVENIEVFGWEAAIRGMRNPMNSWAKSDSHHCLIDFGLDCQMVENGHEPAIKCNDGKFGYCIGENDLGLMQRLYKGGTEHRKYLRMIHVQMDITAPMYWFKEWDTYKIATTSNSTSTMHKIHDKEFALDDFSHEHLYIDNMDVLDTYIIPSLNYYRNRFIETRDKECWWQMIQLLPSSYNQRRTVDFSYETAVNIIKQRSGHKLDEWRKFVEVLKELPYIKEIMEVRYETDRC
ncbi:MAG: hypothetical protein IJN43_13775 [Ruminococcus sp.]|nr:hypothetical protein [Ruminococcus sp.]